MQIIGSADRYEDIVTEAWDDAGNPDVLMTVTDGEKLAYAAYKAEDITVLCDYAKAISPDGTVSIHDMTKLPSTIVTALFAHFKDEASVLGFEDGDSYELFWNRPVFE